MAASDSRVAVPIARMRARAGFDRAFTATVAIRARYWLLAVVALLWAPLRGDVTAASRGLGALGDLVFGAFAKWDATWFVHIAQHGYDSKQSTAFFPLYPLVVHALAHVFSSTLVAGTVVSLV